MDPERPHALTIPRGDRPLTVQSVAFPFAQVGPNAVGGAEQMLWYTACGAVAAGHRSIVVGRAGSVAPGELVSVTIEDGPIDDDLRAVVHWRVGRAIEEAARRWSVDLIHMHGVDFDRYLPREGIPVLATIHLPPDCYPGQALQPRRHGTWLHGVSATQHRALPPGASLLPPIENGVPLDWLAGRHARRGFALCLGRICPEKGWHDAIDAAKRASVPLLLAGAVFPYEAHLRYLRTEIEPRLDERRRLLGAVGFARKRRLLSAARCLLIPSLVAETSSLVAMEALACGTPVIAYPAGALADIVEHGRTGYLVGNVAEMADAIDASRTLDPEDCRAAACARFDIRQTVAQYLERFQALARIAA